MPHTDPGDTFILVDNGAMPQLLGGSTHPELTAAVARELGIDPLPHELSRTPDGEVLVRVDEAARRRAVAIVQPAPYPVGESLLELLLLADACRRVGAERVTAAVPYLGYLRHDRRAHPGEPLGARVIADVLAAAPVDRVLLVDPHTAAVEAAFACPVELLTAVPLLASAIARRLPEGPCVIVAPDLGATKLAERYARMLRLPLAVVHKQRLGAGDVRAEHVLGEVAGRAPVLVDDMISTGGTVAAAVELLLARGARPDVLVVATHGLFADPAVSRLRALPLRRVVTTDSVPQPAELPFPHDVETIAPLVAEAFRRIHVGAPVAELE